MYLKFNNIIFLYDFVKNIIDLYMKVNRRKLVILVLYVNDIMLAINNIIMLYDVNNFFSNHFEIKDMDVSSYVIKI